MLRKRSQTKKRQILHDLTFMWNVKKAQLRERNSKGYYGLGAVEYGDVSQRIQTSSHNTSKILGGKEHHSGYY